MMVLAATPPAAPGDPMVVAGLAVLIFCAVVGTAYFGWAPLRQYILRREQRYEQVLHGSLLMSVEPRSVTIASFVAVLLLAAAGYGLFGSLLAAIVFGLAGVSLPSLVLRFLRSRRRYRLEEQLVDGVQTLSSGVRAGLNLIQAMDLLGESGVRPIGEEFAHLLREYHHGVSVERAMLNTAERLESSNYRLLFSALLTHRERGGDLGDTLDRIADSIREIHRLEKRVETLTAPGRAAARWMGAMPAVILGILYLIDPYGVKLLWTEDVGKLILGTILAFNVVGFLWIRKIVSIDI